MEAMNYTSYIINRRPLQPENFISDLPGIRQMTILVVLPASVVGAVALLALYPAAVAIDCGRLLKLRYYRHLKAQRREQYLKNVMVSLGRSKDEWLILNAA